MHLSTVIRSAAILLTAAAVSSATACTSSQDKAPVVAHGNGSTSRLKDPAAIRQAWVRCMHEAGQTGVTVTKDGEVVMPATRPDTGQAYASALAKAVQTCNAKVPGMQQLREQGGAERIKAAQAFVDCLRKHGVRNIADPDPKDMGAIASPSGVDEATWNKAYETCGKDHPGVPLKPVAPTR
jgi:hypothetical protein